MDNTDINNNEEYRYFERYDDMTEKEEIIAVRSDAIATKYSSYGSYEDRGEEWITEDDFIKIDDKYVIDSEIIYDNMDPELFDELGIEDCRTTSYTDDENFFGDTVYIVSGEMKNTIIELSRYQFDYGEDFLSEGHEVFVFESGEMIKTTVEEYAPEDMYEYYSYWDGSNWQEVALASFHFPVDYEEVTDELNGFMDEREFIYKDRNNDFEGVDYYLFKGKIYGVNWSAYQGSQDFITRGIEADTLFKIAPNLDANKRKLIENIIDEYLDDCNYLSKEHHDAELICDEDGLSYSYKGEVYHLDLDNYFEKDVRSRNQDEELDYARQQIEKRRKDKLFRYYADKIKEIPLDRIYVERINSIKAGNCEVETDRFIDNVCNILNIDSNNFALRADILLGIRDDNYTKRAVINSYVNNYIGI